MLALHLTVRLDILAKHFFLKFLAFLRMSDLIIRSSPAESSLNWPENEIHLDRAQGQLQLTCMRVVTELITFLDDVLRDLDPHVHGVHVGAIPNCFVMIL